MKNKIISFCCIIFIMIMVNPTKVLGSFADFTDEEADRNAKQQIEEQQKQSNETELKSTNNYLKKMFVKGYQLTPEFDKQTINYELKEEISEDYIEISAETDDEKSSVSGIGKVKLNSGENNLRIDITAESGTVRTYFIKVNKIVKKDINISNLKLKACSKENYVYDINITPKFDKKIFEYNCNVQSYIEKIDIETIIDDDNAKVEISGNENLKEGLNEILITITIENEKIVYKVNVEKEHLIQNIIEEKKIDYKNIIIISITAIIIFICICFLKVVLIKRKKHIGKH